MIAQGERDGSDVHSGLLGHVALSHSLIHFFGETFRDCAEGRRSRRETCDALGSAARIYSNPLLSPSDGWDKYSADMGEEGDCRRNPKELSTAKVHEIRSILMGAVEGN